MESNKKVSIGLLPVQCDCHGILKAILKEMGNRTVSAKDELVKVPGFSVEQDNVNLVFFNGTIEIRVTMGWAGFHSNGQTYLFTGSYNPDVSVGGTKLWSTCRWMVDVNSITGEGRAYDAVLIPVPSDDDA